MRPTNVRYVVMGWMCLFALLAYVHRSAVAVPAEQIRLDLGIDDKQMAAVFSFFFWGYTLMQIPGGWLADRLGSRRALFLFVSLWSLATVASGFVTTLDQLLVCRVVMGMAQAGLFPAAVNSFGKWFPARERGLPNGLLGAFMMIGAILSTGPVGFLLEAGLTWHQVFWLAGAPGLVFAGWFYAVFRDSPRQHSGVNAAELEWIEDAPLTAPASTAVAAEPSSRWTLALVLILIPLCGQHFFRGAALIFYTGSWFPTFLEKTRNIPLSQRGLLAALPLAGFTIGCALGGTAMDWVYRRTGSRRLSRSGVAAVCMASCAVLQLLPMQIEDALPAVLILTIACFLGGLGGVASYVLAIDVGGRNIATVFSIMNTAGNLGAALGPDAVVWWKDWQDGNWNSVLVLQTLFWAGACASFAALFFVDRPQPKLTPKTDLEELHDPAARPHSHQPLPSGDRTR